MKFIMPDLQREHWFHVSPNTKQLSLNGLRVYVLWPDTNAACMEGIFSIPLLDFQTIFKIVNKTVISDG